MFELESGSLKRHLILSGILFSAIIVLWPVAMFFTAVPSGALEMQMRYIFENQAAYRLNFLIAGFIGPIIAYLLLLFALFVKTAKKAPVSTVMGIFFLIPYLVFVSMSYTSQYTYFMGLMANGDNTAANWYFLNFSSLAYYLNQLGYVCFAVGGGLIGFRFCLDRGIKRAFGILLELSAVLSIIAFIGLALGNPLINKASLAGGFATLPLGALSMALGFKVPIKQSSV